MDLFWIAAPAIAGETLLRGYRPRGRARARRSLSQEEVAEALAVNQPAVAKLEKRGDMHVSNLRRYEALGGTLEITAHFDKTTVVINNIGGVEMIGAQIT